jgi:hypothetical protein
MSIIDKTLPYEVLIRFGEDGLVKGGHYQDRRIVEIDGERVMDQPGAAKALANSPDEVKALLPGVALTAFVEIARLARLQAAHEQESRVLREALADAAEAARAAGLEAESRTAEVLELQAQIAALSGGPA